MTHHICPFQQPRSSPTRSKFWPRRSAEMASEVTPSSTPVTRCPPMWFTALRCRLTSSMVLRCRLTFSMVLRCRLTSSMVLRCPSELIRNTRQPRTPRRVFLSLPLRGKFNLFWSLFYLPFIEVFFC